MKRSKILALGLALALTAGLLAGCTGGSGSQSPSPTPSQTVTPTPTPSETAPAEKQTVNLAVLKGPSGVGAAKLLADSDAGETANDYAYSIMADNTEIVAGLSSGSLDIAAVASNVAANLYNKTNGGIQIAAVSGLGVLYILENGNTVQSMADLKGQTLYATGQGANPEYVLNYLLTENGVDPAEVDIQWKTADEVSALMVSGEARLCMMPVPAATAIQMSNPDVREALDLSAEWDGLNNGSHLTMTCIAVRTAFAQEHPEAVENFLADYAASVEYVKGDPAAASELVAQYGITPKAKIAELAIPKCSLVCITGKVDMADAIQGYFEVLSAANPDALGGSIPDDGFYFE
ncbi:ABC transporter substrate-binding protein [Intestinimonas massiliensis (ex Afouda et al. 2020)]|uniref:ABC transporter substrate-binding protein n=1 Tax=Intestinimonas massiliensis (ex Afouda et al. 2020) TaxID=1673721 RepID=A0AAW5JN58_9FIRM|nr:ABC transporter substrate-binding protein [Intestinimonas massiliensis (ex Afouda et al. 2020)]MCI5561959.1 ABC transporter substrate-binding protein [Intestinimonas massiliensis (ex Afouda et al. 2020)]MCQ4769299.1 ABC transporter substrate-binding protein [Intestinimonas massiliensis (ex Afouda et al. 2020)]